MFRAAAAFFVPMLHIKKRFYSFKSLFLSAVFWLLRFYWSGSDQGSRGADLIRCFTCWMFFGSAALILNAGFSYWLFSICIRFELLKSSGPGLELSDPWSNQSLRSKATPRACFYMLNYIFYLVLGGQIRSGKTYPNLKRFFLNFRQKSFFSLFGWFIFIYNVPG